MFLSPQFHDFMFPLLLINLDCMNLFFSTPAHVHFIMSNIEILYILKFCLLSSTLGEYSCFIAFNYGSVFCKCYDHCFPMTAVERNYRSRKTWLSKGLKNSIKLKK